MKKNFILLFFALFVSGAVMGQISLRPQVGVNVPSISKDAIKGDLGFQFGADLQIGNSFYVQPGLNFQTGKIDFEDGVGGINVSNINVPLLIGIAFGEGEDASFGFRAFAGPNFSFHAGDDLRDVSTNDFDFKSTVISGQVGLGLDISIIFVDLAYQFGLSNIFDGGAFDDAKRHLFLANAGVRIGF